MRTPKVEILIGGIRWAAWVDLALSVSVESLCRAATLRMVGPVEQIKIGQTAKMTVDSSPILTGFVESVSITHDGANLSASVTVASKTMDLVDCHVRARKRWQGVKPSVVVAELAADYEISVVAEVTETAIARASASRGDGIADVIETVCRMGAVVATDNGEGDVIITRPGLVFSGSTITPGDGLLSSVTVSANGRNVFDTYDCRGSIAHPDAEDVDFLANSTGSAESFGGRGRYLFIRPEQSGAKSDMTRRALWEAATRAGQSVTATASMLGWFDSTGQLWTAGNTVRLAAPSCGLDGGLVIQSVNYSINSDSYTCDLELVSPDMYVPTPRVVNRSTGTKGSKAWANVESYFATKKGTP